MWSKLPVVTIDDPPAHSIWSNPRSVKWNGAGGFPSWEMECPLVLT